MEGYWGFLAGDQALCSTNTNYDTSAEKGPGSNPNKKSCSIYADKSFCLTYS